MSNICAGIGRGQMLVLDKFIARRRDIHAYYTEYFKNIEGITVKQNPSPDYNSNFWLTCILIDPEKTGFTPEDARIFLESKNIETRQLWKPMHLQPVFEQYPFYGDGTSEKLFNSGLCLPSGASLTDQDIKRVCSHLAELIKKIRYTRITNKKGFR